MTVSHIDRFCALENICTFTYVSAYAELLGMSENAYILYLIIISVSDISILALAFILDSVLRRLCKKPRLNSQYLRGEAVAVARPPVLLRHVTI